MRFLRLGLSALLSAAICCAAVFGFPAAVYARDGMGGFDGTGISQGEIVGRTTLDYQEYIFITGEPVLIKGSLTIGKSMSDNITLSTYSYRLNSTNPMIQLTREFSFETVSTPKDNGQTVTETHYIREPSERINIGGETFTLRNFDFTRTSLIDEKPAVAYYSGNTWYRKQYEIGGGASTVNSGNYVNVEATGEFYGFDQYWGNADVETTNLVVDYQKGLGEDAEHWSGTATVTRSQSTVTELRYVQNEPNAISFRGGFLETKRNDNILEYTARMPEFDAAGISTDRIKRWADSIQIETFPSAKRLISPDLRQIRGHWAEEAISKLFGLEILYGGSAEFIPDQFITRAQFADAVVGAAKAIPKDPFVKEARKSSSSRGKSTEPTPSFSDVPATHTNFAQIEEAFRRGLFTPMERDHFVPNGNLTVADAAVVFIRAMGLQAVASYHGAITNYADDDSIPDYAREALYVCQDIGLLLGDQNGNINPAKCLTNGEAAVMIDRFVEYMREDLKADYRERILN